MLDPVIVYFSYAAYFLAVFSEIDLIHVFLLFFWIQI